MFAIGNDELENLPEVKEGDRIKCPKCGDTHTLEAGTDSKTKQKSDLLQYYTCKGKHYLAAVKGKLIV